jgi:hypothetical protein
MHITRADIDRATDEARDPWAISNGALYALCRKYPDHRSLKASTAKMLLIGRTYAATAERGRSAGSSAHESGDDFYTDVLPRALKRSRLDVLLEQLRNKRVATAANLTDTLAVHWELMRVLRDLTGQGKRSLASKYLHFHAPKLFFLFDNRAAQTLGRIVSVRERSSARRGFCEDAAYARFVSCALVLRGQIDNRFGMRLSPRQLDRVLLSLHAAERRGVTVPDEARINEGLNS